jgi:hypothetical protein
MLIKTEIYCFDRKEPSEVYTSSEEVFRSAYGGNPLLMAFLDNVLVCEMSIRGSLGPSISKYTKEREE